ncbi:MAG: hypothetical protein CMH49_04310 [Myxococcales bacterium]|nr:hypothetical protein [Myxococcales bacterium]
MKELRRNYTLFIDESGQFGEEALKTERKSSNDQPSSQICGVLVPGVFEKKKRGADLPHALLSLFPKGGEMHATEITYAERAQLVKKVLQQSKNSGWRLVRLVNNSGIGEGEVIQTYTRMVAEMIVCIYRKLREEEPQERPVINLTYAQVLLGKRIDGRDYYFSRKEISGSMRYQGTPIMIPILEYKEAIARELQIDLRHGLGLDEQEVTKVFGQVNEESARIHPALQLSDLISNCSYKRGRALRNYQSVRQKLLNTLEPYDFELHPLQVQHVAEELANHRALGQAIFLILSHLHTQQLSQIAKVRLSEVLEELIEDLAKEHSKELAIDLQALVDAIDDLVQRERDASEAELMIHAIFDQVLKPLEAELKDLWGNTDLEWFRFKLLNLALINANHSGDIQLARQRVILLQDLRSKVNNRWEELPTVMESQLNIAVNFGDRFLFSEGVEIAEEVCGFYQDFTSLLGAFRGQSLISDHLKIRNHMAALGTTLMLERYLCLEKLSNGEVIDDVLIRSRAIAEQALALSDSKEDKMRLWQQYAHLEGLAGDFKSAWQKLFLGVGGQMNEFDLSQTQSFIERLAQHSDMSIKFPMYHTLRLLLLDLQSRRPSDQINVLYQEISTLFVKRFRKLIDGYIDDYPAHALLRTWAVLNALKGEEAVAVGALRVLDRIVQSQKSSLALWLISLCAQLESAVYLAKHGSKQRVKLILEQGVHSKSEKKQIKNQSTLKMLAKLKSQAQSEERLLNWLESLEKQIETWRKNDLSAETAEIILKLCARYSG